MKILIAGLLLLSASGRQCLKNKAADKIPTCIQQKIDAIKGEPKWNPPARVDQYSYHGKTVYLFSSNCCDQYNVVYDAQCNYVCAPSGGFTGRGDMKCTDFDSTAKLFKVGLER